MSTQRFCRLVFVSKTLSDYGIVGLVLSIYRILIVAMSWPIKFTPGSKPGVKRKTVSENLKTVEKNKYKDNWVRDFKQEWQKVYICLY